MLIKVDYRDAELYSKCNALLSSDLEKYASIKIEKLNIIDIEIQKKTINSNKNNIELLIDHSYYKEEKAYCIVPTHIVLNIKKYTFNIDKSEKENKIKIIVELNREQEKEQIQDIYLEIDANKENIDINDLITKKEIYLYFEFLSV